MERRKIARVFRISDDGTAHIEVAFGEEPIGSATIPKEAAEKIHLKEGDIVSLEFDEDWNPRNIKILHP